MFCATARRTHWPRGRGAASFHETSPPHALAIPGACAAARGPAADAGLRPRLRAAATGAPRPIAPRASRPTRRCIARRWCRCTRAGRSAGAARLPTTPGSRPSRPARTRYTRYEVIGWYGGRRALGDFRIEPAVRPMPSGTARAPRLAARPAGHAGARRSSPAPAGGRVLSLSGTTYRVWPGPNSNTFVAHLGRAIPELRLAMPSTAIGKDYVSLREFVGPSPSHTGVATVRCMVSSASSRPGTRASRSTCWASSPASTSGTRRSSCRASGAFPATAELRTRRAASRVPSSGRLSPDRAACITDEGRHAAYHPQPVQALRQRRAGARRVSLDVPPGMFGLLGPNGAGKSTLMRTLATLQGADSGTATLGDIDVLREPGAGARHAGLPAAGLRRLPQGDRGTSCSTTSPASRASPTRRSRRETVDALLERVNLARRAQAEARRILGRHAPALRHRAGAHRQSRSS